MHLVQIKFCVTLQPLPRSSVDRGGMEDDGSAFPSVERSGNTNMSPCIEVQTDMLITSRLAKLVNSYMLVLESPTHTIDCYIAKPVSSSSSP